jgi:hypothetical protein
VLLTFLLPAAGIVCLVMAGLRRHIRRGARFRATRRQTSSRSRRAHHPRGDDGGVEILRPSQKARSDRRFAQRLIVHVRRVRDGCGAVVADGTG